MKMAGTTGTFGLLATPQTQSSRRDGFPVPPLTPPYMRARIRRFAGSLKAIPCRAKE